MGALLAIDRDDLPGDIAASLLLLVAIGWSGVAIPFISGIAAGLIVRRRFWRRLWVFVLPTAAYLLWASQYGEQDVLWENLHLVPDYVARMAGAGLTSIAGLPQSLDLLLAAGLALVTVVRLWQLRRRSPLAWEAAVMGLGYWTLTAFARAQEGAPTTNRYIYPSAVFILLLLVGISPDLTAAVGARRQTLTRWIGAAVLVATAAAVAVNISRFQPGRDGLVFTSNVTSAELGALELARDVVEPEYAPSLNEFPAMPAAYFFSAVARFGSSPADTPGEIARSPEYARRRADRVSIQALRIHLADAPGDARIAAVPPGPAITAAGAEKRGGCIYLKVPPLSLAAGLPSHGILIRAAPKSEMTVDLRRFAQGFVGPVPSHGRGRDRTLRPVPDGEENRPWRFRVTAERGPLRICRLAAGAR
jgi:hypothetical protein